MTTINKNQGNVKLSEVGTDSAQELILTPENEDALTVVERLRRVTTDGLRKSSMILLSDIPIEWSGLAEEVRIPTTGKMILKLLLNPASGVARTVSLRYNGVANATLNGGVANPTRTSIKLNDGEVLYIELSRALLDAANPNIDLDFITPGMRLRVATQATMPILESDPSATQQNTLCIPLVIRQDDTVNSVRNIWWIPHGILWSGAILSYLGQITTSATIPLGGIMYLHLPNGGTNATVSQATLNTLAPGFWLCNGSQITNPASAFYLQYTPNINGQSGNPNSAQSGGRNITDTGTDTTPQPAVIRGNLSSPTSNNFTGNNLHQLSASQLAAHIHTSPAHGHRAGQTGSSNDVTSTSDRSGTAYSNSYGVDSSHTHQVYGENAGGARAVSDQETGNNQFSTGISSGAHSHAVRVNNQAVTINANTPADGSHNNQARAFFAIAIMRVV